MASLKAISRVLSSARAQRQLPSDYPTRHEMARIGLLSLRPCLTLPPFRKIILFPLHRKKDLTYKILKFKIKKLFWLVLIYGYSKFDFNEGLNVINDISKHLRFKLFRSLSCFGAVVLLRIYLLHLDTYIVYMS